MWLQSLPASESTSIIRGHLCVIPSFVGHHHNFPRVGPWWMCLFMTRTTFQYFRQINFSRRIKAHNNNLELLSPNKKWFYADAIIIQDFQVCGYWIDDHYRIWGLIVTNHFKSHLLANKGDTFYNNKLEYIIHSYDHTHTGVMVLKNMKDFSRFSWGH